MLPAIQAQHQTITSFELYKIINHCREDAGESKIRVNDFNARIVDELDGFHYESFVVQNPNKTESTAYHLTIEQATLVGMRESKSVRRAVLEKLKPAKKDPLLELANAVLTAQKIIDEQSNRLSIAEPKAAAFDLISDAEGELCLTDAAKHLQISPSKLIYWMQINKWIYKRDGSKSWVAYQNRIDQGLLIHRRAKFTRTSGAEDYSWQALVTPKGISDLAKNKNIQEFLAK